MIRRVTRWVDMLGMPHLKNGDYLVPVWNKSDGKDYPITIEYDDGTGEPAPKTRERVVESDGVAAKLTAAECKALDLIIAAVVATERAEAVKGMHAEMCDCHDEYRANVMPPQHTSGPCWGADHPFIDPRCLAARKEAADGT